MAMVHFYRGEIAIERLARPARRDDKLGRDHRRCDACRSFQLARQSAFCDSDQLDARFRFFCLWRPAGIVITRFGRIAYGFWKQDILRRCFRTERFRRTRNGRIIFRPTSISSAFYDQRMGSRRSARCGANYLWIFVLFNTVMDAEDLTSILRRSRWLTRRIRRRSGNLFERVPRSVAPGWLVVLLGAIFNSIIFFVAFSTLKLKDASSEVLPFESLEWHPLKQVSEWAETNLKRKQPLRRSKKARQRIRSIHKTEA